MTDSLSPLFIDRNARLSVLPDEQRMALEAVEKQSGDPMFADRQFSAIWISKRTGLPQEEVLKNFDGLAARYFGEGTTPSQAYDRISGLYQPKAEAGRGKVGAQAKESVYSVGGTVIAKDVLGSIPGGASSMGYDTLGGFYANLAAATRVTLKRPEDDPDYQAASRRLRLADDPTAFDFRDEPMGFGGMADEMALEADQKAMQAIRDRVQAENMAALEAASGTFRKGYSDDARKIAETMYDLSKKSVGAFGVRAEFQETAVGQLVATAGSLPVTVLMATLGPVLGSGAMYAGIYGQVEQERMEVEGESYDPTAAWLENAASAGPQAALEFAFGMERLMGKIINMTPKVGGKIAFGDAARVMARTGLVAGAGEAITEPAQGFWNDWVASITYNEGRELMSEEVLKQRLLESASAFALGFLFGGGVQGLQVVDRNRAADKAERFLLTREGAPFEGPDFAALRVVKTDKELRAMATDGLGDTLVAAANGDVAAQKAYRQETLSKAFVDTDGLTAHGITIGKVRDGVAFRLPNGVVFTYDEKNPEMVDWYRTLQREAVAKKEATQATINEMRRRFGNLLEVEKREAPKKLSELREKGVITGEQQADALAAAADINEALGADAMDALVMGSAKLTRSEADGLLRMVINVAQGAEPTVAIEEVSEAWYKKAVAEGRNDPMALRGYREQWHKDNGEADPVADGRVTAERADIEWFSKRVIEYALANRKTELPGGWGDWLRTLGERLKKLLRGATRMKKMLREGKITPELEGWFREALGADVQAEQRANAQAVTQAELEAVFAELSPEAQQIAQEAENKLRDFERLKNEYRQAEALQMQAAKNADRAQDAAIAQRLEERMREMDFARARAEEAIDAALSLPERTQLSAQAQRVVDEWESFSLAQLNEDTRGTPVYGAGEGGVSFSLAQEKVVAMETALREAGFKPVSSTIERGGAHTPSDPESGAPAWGLNTNGIYANDVYSANALRYYGTGEEKMDREALAVLSRVVGRADKQVRIYRAVEKDSKAKGIQPGDWVAIVKGYAVEHGKAALGGNYRIQEKLVMAGEVFTSGDSWLEWGYHPQDHGVLVRATSQAKQAGEGGVTFSLGRAVPADATFAATGIPQNQTQAMQQQGAKFAAKQAAMFPYPYHRISSQPSQAKVSLGGHEAGIMGRMLLPVSERLRFIADKAGTRTGILYRARRYYSEKGTNLKRYSDEVTPLMRGIAKMSTQDMKVFKAAASNQDAAMRNQVLAKYGLQGEWAQYEAARDSLRAEMIAAGIKVGDIGEYFPRWVKDVTGLRESFGITASEGPLEQAMIEAEKSVGRALTNEEVNAVLDGAVRGVNYGVKGGAAPSNTKQRKIATIADTQLDFYADPNLALSRWLNQGTEAIARYRFFGKAAQSLPALPMQLNLDVSIGTILAQEVAAGNLDPKAQMEVKSMMDGLFGYHGQTNKYIRGFMDLSYWATMAKLSSSLAQLTDIMVSVYEAGPWNTGMALTEAMWRNAKNLPGIGNSKTLSEAVANFTKGKDWLTREQLGIDRLMAEFDDQRFTTIALNEVFTATGLNYMDGLGKDTLLNAKFRQLAKQAKRSAGLSASNRKMIEQIFGKATAAQVIVDFRAGTKNADTVFAVYNVLADWQPISLLEYPEAYAKNPNARVLYMLKSYSIKMLAAYRREGFMKMWYGSPEEKMEGARNLAYLLAMLFMAGATKDWLVDFVLDRDPQMEDLVWDNMFKLIQVSRYAIWQQRNRSAELNVYGGIEAGARIAQNIRQILTDMIAPPTVLIERPAKDAAAWAKAQAEHEPWTFWESESVQFIPVAGEFLYWLGPAGQAKIKRRKKLREREANR